MHGKSFSDQTVYAIPFFHTEAHSNSTEMYKLLFPRCERTLVRPCAHLLLCVALSLSSYLYCCNFILMLEYSFFGSHSQPLGNWAENANWCEPLSRRQNATCRIWVGSLLQLILFGMNEKKRPDPFIPHSIGHPFLGILNLFCILFGAGSFPPFCAFNSLVYLVLNARHRLHIVVVCVCVHSFIGVEGRAGWEVVSLAHIAGHTDNSTNAKTWPNI